LSVSISDLNIRTGDKVRIVSYVVVDAPAVEGSGASRYLTGKTGSGRSFHWHHAAMDKIEVVSRAKRAKRGEVWMPNEHMVPVYYDGCTFKFPYGMGADYGNEMPEDKFFRTFPDSFRVINTLNLVRMGLGKRHEEVRQP
jgi:hypothetical protein